MTKQIDWLKNTNIAHRGLHSQDLKVPENTKAAFLLAIENNFGIECDLNITKDNEVVVIHDHNLKRLCDSDVNLYDITLSEARNYKILNSNEGILTLKELLLLVDGRVPLLIEVKPKMHKNILINALPILEAYKGVFSIFSFDPRVCYYLKKHNKNITRGLIAGVEEKGFILNKINKLAFNRFVKPDFISYNINYMPNKYLDKAEKKGIIIIGFVARNQEKLDYVRDIYSNTVFEFFTPKEIK
jgi:glycerophosphoryl diester phosphodiesterase